MSILSKQETLSNKVQYIIAKAKELGATQVEVAGHYGKAIDIQTRMGQIENLAFHQDKGLALNVYFNQKKGSASTTDFDETALNYVIEKACAIAKYTQDDTYSGLADKQLLAWDYPDLDLYHPWDVNVPQIVEKMIESEQKALSVDKCLTNSDGVSFASGSTLHFYGNSHDFMGHYATSSHSFSCSLVAESKDAKERDYEYTIGRRPEQLKAFNNVAISAANKVIKRLDARSLTPRQAPVIFIPTLARGIFSNFLAGISGRNLYNETSFLLGKLNQIIMPQWLNIYEDPFLLQGLASSPFDAEGVKSQPRQLINQGCLQGYLLNSYSARRLGMQTTANAGGAHNILVDHSDISFEAMIKQMHTGLIVTELLGHGVNLVNGNYSRGAAGFWVENGEIAYPVHEITIAGNLTDMLLGISAIANDIDKRGTIQTGSILIDKMTVAGS